MSKRLKFRSVPDDVTVIARCKTCAEWWRVRSGTEVAVVEGDHRHDFQIERSDGKPPNDVEEL